MQYSRVGRQTQKLTTVENHEGNIGHPSTKLTSSNKQSAIEWRRSQVMDLDSKGYSQREIAAKLQIAKGTVTNDMTYLKQQAQQRLHVHIQEVIPLEFQRGMNVLRQILKSSLEIGESTADPRIRLEANRIASDTVKHIQEMMTGGAICSEAFRLVSEKGMQKNMETIEMLDKRMAESKAQTEEGEETTEETTTTNDVF